MTYISGGMGALRIGIIVQAQRDACADSVAALKWRDAPAQEVADSVARDLRDVEPLVLTLPLSGPVAAELLHELADDGGIVGSIPLLTRMACVQYVLAVADHSLEAMRPILRRIAEATRAAPLIAAHSEPASRVV